MTRSLRHPVAVLAAAAVLVLAALTLAAGRTPAQARRERDLGEPQLQRRAQPGASTSFGFQGTWTASDAAPAAFTLNAKACT